MRSGFFGQFRRWRDELFPKAPAITQRPCPPELRPPGNGRLAVPILMYHKIGPVAHSPFWVSTRTFRLQLRALRAGGFASIPLQAFFTPGAPLPPKPVVITFDDGYEGVFTDAFPILKKFGFTATCFLPTQRIGGTNAWDAGDCQPLIRHLDWTQVALLQRSGVVDFQAHTETHTRLTELALDPEALERELVGCREAIQSRLNKPVEYISWPFGAHDARVIEAAREAGFRGGLAAEGGLAIRDEGPWSVKRIMMHRDGTMVYDPLQPGYPFASWVKG